MSATLDKWHARYHGDATDYACPYCQDETMRLPETLPLPVVEIDAEVEWGAWLEATYDPDDERLEDLDGTS